MAQVRGSAGTSNPLFPDRKSGVWGESDSGYGVAGTANTGNGVQAGSISGFGAVGTSDESIGVFGISSNNVGVYGLSDAAGSGYGIVGSGTTGVTGRSSELGTGVRGEATGEGTIGVDGYSDGGYGMRAFSVSGVGILAMAYPGVGLAVEGGAVFSFGDIDIHQGNLWLDYDLRVSGPSYIDNHLYVQSLFASTKNFKVDHPQDPAHKYLYHASVESDDYKNIYDGITILDGNGEAIVSLPEWFEALNGDFRYQLTCIGQHSPVYIAEEITNNRFKISGGSPGLKVCWQVTSIRHDAVVKANPMVVEEDKPLHESGYYLNPEAHGQPKENGIHWAHNAERRQRLEKLQKAGSAISERPAPPTPPPPPKLP